MKQWWNSQSKIKKILIVTMLAADVTVLSLLILTWHHDKLFQQIG